MQTIEPIICRYMQHIGSYNLQYVQATPRILGPSSIETNELVKLDAVLFIVVMKDKQKDTQLI